mmetsp:Transcript_64935/g.184398  ORF Transcript_64935/g.184398 Transcript_64935/m.184398 type:complete len:429 (+) Transcript_64935:114-1400(+)
MFLCLLCAGFAGAQADHGHFSSSSGQALVSTMMENQLYGQEHGGPITRLSTGLRRLSAMVAAIDLTADATGYTAMDDGDAIISASGSVSLIQRGHLFQNSQGGTFQHTSQAFPSGAGALVESLGGSYQNASSPHAQMPFHATLPMALVAERIPSVSTSTVVVLAIGVFVVVLAICWGCGSSSNSTSDEPLGIAAPSPGYPRGQSASAAAPAALTPAPSAQLRPRRQKYLGDGNTQAFCRELTVLDTSGSTFILTGKALPYQQEEVLEVRRDGFQQAPHEAVLKCTTSETRGHCGILLETSMGSSVVYMMTDEAVSPKGEQPPQQDRHVALVRMNNRDLPADPLPTAVVERTNGSSNLCVRWCTPTGQPGGVLVSMLVHANHGIDLRNKDGSLVATLKCHLGEHGRLHIAKGMDVALVVSAMIAALKLQ